MCVKERVWKFVDWIWLRLVTNEYGNWCRVRTKCGQNLEKLNYSFCRDYYTTESKFYNDESDRKRKVHVMLSESWLQTRKTLRTVLSNWKAIEKGDLFVPELRSIRYFEAVLPTNTCYNVCCVKFPSSFAKQKSDPWWRYSERNVKMRNAFCYLRGLKCFSKWNNKIKLLSVCKQHADRWLASFFSFFLSPRLPACFSCLFFLSLSLSLCCLFCWLFLSPFSSYLFLFFLSPTQL